MISRFFNHVLFFGLFLITVGACKNEGGASTDAETKALETAFEKDASNENFEKLISKYLEFIKKSGPNTEANQSLLLKAANASEKASKPAQQVIFLNNLVRDYPDRADSKDNILKMVNLLAQIDKKGASDVMALAFIKANPSDSRGAELKRNLPNIASAEEYILEIGKAIFADTVKGFSETSAHAYVDACEAFALALPKDPEAPEYINKAAEISNALKTYEKSFSLYDWLSSKYPEHKRGQMALFMKAFLFDESLKDVENAKKYYQEFITKFPNHEFAKQAQLLMENLGKSQDEVLKNLQEKAKVK